MRAKNADLGKALLWSYGFVALAGAVLLLAASVWDINALGATLLLLIGSLGVLLIWAVRRDQR